MKVLGLACALSVLGVLGCADDGRAPPPAQPAGPTPPPGPPPPPMPMQPPAPAPAPQPAISWATPVEAANDGGANVALQFFAVNNAGGMQSEGGLVLAKFKEGDVAEQLVTIVPGRCYTLLAAGVGVEDVDLKLVSLAGATIAQGPSGQKLVAIGEKGKCVPTGQFPAQAKMVVRAARGTGTIAARAYVK